MKEFLTITAAMRATVRRRRCGWEFFRQDSQDHHRFFLAPESFARFSGSGAAPKDCLRPDPVLLEDCHGGRLLPDPDGVSSFRGG